MRFIGHWVLTRFAKDAQPQDLARFDAMPRAIAPRKAGLCSSHRGAPGSRPLEAGATPIVPVIELFLLPSSRISVPMLLLRAAVGDALPAPMVAHLDSEH